MCYYYKRDFNFFIRFFKLQSFQIGSKAPLGQEKTGKSPVDRKKLGTKRSIIVDKKGVAIECALGEGNQHDSKLFDASIRSIPACVRQPFNKEMYLDSAYNSKVIRVILFNYGYVPKISKNKRNSKVLIPVKKIEKKRWVVEGAHSWMNRFRRLLIRFEKYASKLSCFDAICLFNHSFQ